jgi:Tautomerase enzyme
LVDRPTTEGEEVPLITVKLIEGVFGAEDKHEMIEQLTETMVGSKVRTCGA